MPTYLYCLVAAADAIDPRAEAPAGIDGAAVRMLAAGALEAWVSTIASASPPATVESARAHDLVVSAALATGRTPLPARFGQTWPSDAECVTSVTQRSAELEPLLRRVAGLVEMTVCTLLPATPATRRAPDATRDEATRGSAYLRELRSRADQERRLRTLLEELRARVSRTLAPLSRGEVAQIRGSDGALALSLSYLVERGGETRFRDAVDAVAREVAARLVVAGPHAPYSFAPATRQPGRPYADRPADRP